ncbi:MULTISPECIES: sulfatase family protein [Flavobacteriaceae]|uniref:sulfatase family protein n=1 Tax=Flavobacteriaceae TaxID=49546 RepID=UPI00234A9B04|nr:sulfatase-like hydrolase/transferase [Muricauda sp. SP22]MDC6362634.1 sulfatase-like hydrolase/transferase [Muricauda sp. SP22]
MKKTIHSILFLLSITFCGVSCSSKPSKIDKKESQKTPTNIILLMGDDHGWEEAGYNQHPYIKTPVLDDMAEKGLVLNRFYSAHPSCSPTRGSIITGRHPNRYGVYTPGWSIRPEEISIAQLLKDVGYTTAHFGKWHLGPVKEGSPTNPGAMGFDTWISHDNFFEIDPLLSRNGAPPVQIKGEGSEVIIDETIAFIDKAKQDKKPFFSVVWFGSPHEPYEALPEDLALYKDLPDSLGNKYTRITSLKTGEQVRRPLDSVLPERYAEITAMDRAIGKLRTYLESEGIKENTLIWYCGDNGIPPSGLYNSRLKGLKGTVYEGGTKVPGIIEWPQKIKKSRVSEVNAVTTDIFSTVCEVAGAKLPKRPLDGISLLPVIRGEAKERLIPIQFWNFDIGHLKDNDPYIDPELQEGTTPLAKISEGKFTRSFKNFHHPEVDEKDYLGDRSILNNQYKLVIDDRNGNVVKELYNVHEDPGETNNLIDEYSDIAFDLEQQMKVWQESVLLSLTGQDYIKKEE